MSYAINVQNIRRKSSGILKLERLRRLSDRRTDRRTDRQTDRRTDGRTDGRTDKNRQTIAVTLCLRFAVRVNERHGQTVIVACR